MKQLNILVFLIFIKTILTQQIVDFTYAHYLEKGSIVGMNQHKLDKLTPSKYLFTDYKFPDICKIGAQLDLTSLASRQQQQKDLDTYLKEMKSNFIELLKISQKIKNMKSHISQLKEISDSSYGKYPVNSKDIQTLKSQQKILQQINKHIQLDEQQLKELMKESGSTNNYFTEAALNFQIESLQYKINFLRSLKKKSDDNQPVKPSQFQDYFHQLNDKFKQQSSLISQLSQLLSNFNELAKLKATKTNLNSQIQAYQLIIDQKKSCEKELLDIKNNYTQKGQIKQLMKSLRLKKLQFQNQNSRKYCQGVAAKLADRLAQLLKVHNYTYNCAQGRKDLQYKILRLREQLLEIQGKLKNIQTKQGLQNYKTKFDKNRQFMKKKLDEINQFRIGAYQHSSYELQKIIERTQQALNQAKTKKAKVLEKSSRSIDQKKVKMLIDKIKKAKAHYCRENDQYQKKAKQVWKQFYKHEESIEYSNKMYQMHLDQIKKLRTLQELFQNIKQQILSKMP